MPTTEAFPQLITTHDKVDRISRPSTNDNVNTTWSRRKSSGLGGEIRAGDTSAPAFATLDVIPQSPRSIKAENERDRKKPFSKRRKAKSLFQLSKRYALRHTWVLPLILVCIFLSLYAIDTTPSNLIHHFLFLSYELPLEPGAEPGTPVQYRKGKWDIAFVSFYTIVLSFTREFIM